MSAWGIAKVIGEERRESTDESFRVRLYRTRWRIDTAHHSIGTYGDLECCKKVSSVYFSVI